jgi:phospholipase C
MSRVLFTFGLLLPLSAAAVASAHGCGSSAGATSDDAGSDGEAGKDAIAGDALPDAGTDADDAAANLVLARAKIKHIVVINQENRSFDTYFGTFPGADGIPMDGGVPTVCNDFPDGGCEKPYHNKNDLNYGGGHGHGSFVTCVADGGMSGFIKNADEGKNCDAGSIEPGCKPAHIDVMGYHTDAELPNYWAYAKNFVLQDHIFEPVSAWAATCTPPNDPNKCVTDLVNPGNGDPAVKKGSVPEYAWTDITYLLHSKGVSWNYFVAGGTEPDCEDGDVDCKGTEQNYLKPGFWNILPWFDTVKEDDEVANILDTNQFYDNVKAGKLASVTWLIPSYALSEHPTALLTRGQAYVTELVNEIMKSSFWDSTVIFLTWDDWGGFYDHMNPLLPEYHVDPNGYGIRVPGMTISPWVKQGLIDKQVLSHDAYLKFIEDIFLDSQRLNPANDGRPDSRIKAGSTVRENDPQLGDLLSEFDFTQVPLAPLVLEPCPAGVDTVYGPDGPCEP